MNQIKSTIKVSKEADGWVGVSNDEEVFFCNLKGEFRSPCGEGVLKFCSDKVTSKRIINVDTIETSYNNNSLYCNGIGGEVSISCNKNYWTSGVSFCLRVLGVALLDGLLDETYHLMLNKRKIATLYIDEGGLFGSSGYKIIIYNDAPSGLCGIECEIIVFCIVKGAKEKTLSGINL